MTSTPVASGFVAARPDRPRQPSPTTPASLLALSLALAACLGLSASAGAADTEWPCWSGPRCDFSATPEGLDLVDSLSDARLLWTSEAQTPICRAQSMRYEDGAANRRGAGGGGASPVVAGGRVYLSYFVPSGRVHDEELEREMKSAGKEFDRRLWLIGADDCVLSIDAANGKTLWTRTFRGKGINWHDSKAGPSNASPVVAYGKVVALGTTGRLYGIDASTGVLRWMSDVGPRHRAIEALKARCLRERSFRGHATFNRDFAGALIAAGGRVVMADQDGNPSGLLAIDPETGKEAWRLPKAIAKDSTPARWAEGEREFVVAATPAGLVTCVEASSGAILWRLDDCGHNPRTLTAHGEYLLLHFGPIPESGYRRGNPPVRPSRLGCLRLRTSGPEKLWELPEEWGPSGHNPVAAWGGRAYARLSGRIACIELSSGKVLAEAPSPGDGSGFIGVVEGRLICDRDGAHSETELWMFEAVPPTLRPMGDPWRPPHPHTSTYWVPASHPIVDGRIFIRGADAIYAYDLTKTDSKTRRTKPGLNLKPVNFSDPPRAFVESTIRRWPLFVEKQLQDEDPDLAKRAVGRLERQLDAVLRAVPESARGRFAGLKLFLMYGEKARGGGRNNGLEYFQRHAPKHFPHLEPRMGSSILIYSAENYDWLPERRALMALFHEFAHAYHLEEWPETEPAIFDAWENAVRLGLYRNVEDEEGRALPEGYARINQLEYFAELSMMYFVGGYYEPFTRDGLEAYDPGGWTMVRETWGVTEGETPPVEGSPVAERCGDPPPSGASSSERPSRDAAQLDR